MKKLLGLIVILLLFACEKEEVIEPYYPIAGEWKVWGEMNYEFITLIQGDPDSWQPHSFVWEFKEDYTLFQDDTLFGSWRRNDRILEIYSSDCYKYEMFWLSESDLILKSR